MHLSTFFWEGIRFHETLKGVKGVHGTKRVKNPCSKQSTKFVHSVCLLAVVKLSQIMRLNSDKRSAYKLCFIVHRQSETLFDPLSIKDIKLEMQPRMQHVFTQSYLLVSSSCNENCNRVMASFKTAWLWKFMQLFSSCSIQTDRLDETNKWFLQHLAVNVPKIEYDTVSALLTVSVIHQNVFPLPVDYFHSCFSV